MNLLPIIEKLLLHIANKYPELNLNDFERFENLIPPECYEELKQIAAQTPMQVVADRAVGNRVLSLTELSKKAVNKVLYYFGEEFYADKPLKGRLNVTLMEYLQGADRKEGETSHQKSDPQSLLNECYLLINEMGSFERANSRITGESKSNILHLAARLEATNIMRGIFKEYPRLNWTTLNGKRETPLFLAVQSGNFESVKLILEQVRGSIRTIEKARNTYINRKTKSCYTAIMVAAELGYIKIAGLLLEHGASIVPTSNVPLMMPLRFFAPSDIKCVPLMMALRSGHHDIVRLFLLHSVNKKIPIETFCIWSEVFSDAVKRGDYQLCKLIIEILATSNARFDRRMKNLVFDDALDRDAIGLLRLLVSKFSYFREEEYAITRDNGELNKRILAMISIALLKDSPRAWRYFMSKAYIPEGIAPHFFVEAYLQIHGLEIFRKDAETMACLHALFDASHHTNDIRGNWIVNIFLKGHPNKKTLRRAKIACLHALFNAFHYTDYIPMEWIYQISQEALDLGSFEMKRRVFSSNYFRRSLNREGESLLHFAIRHRKLGFIRYCSRFHNIVNILEKKKSLVFLAFELKCIDILDFFLQLPGFDLRKFFRNDHDHEDFPSFFCLFYKQENLELLRRLFDSPHVNFNTKFEEAKGVTPLQIAASRRHNGIVELLSKKPINFSLTNNQGFHALDAAILSDNRPVMALLKRAGLHPSFSQAIKDEKSIPPNPEKTNLSASISKAHLESLRHAIKANNIEMVKYVLHTVKEEVPADMQSRKSERDLELHRAARLEDKRIFLMMLEHPDFDVNATLSDTATTLLMVLSARGEMRVLATLLFNDADCHQTNAYGLNARDAAILGGHQHLDAFFENKGVPAHQENKVYVTEQQAIKQIKFLKEIMAAEPFNVIEEEEEPQRLKRKREHKKKTNGKVPGNDLVSKNGYLEGLFKRKRDVELKEKGNRREVTNESSLNN